ncbi:MAG: hypothetical protein ABSG34_16345, partial [Candidatus Sulfotelmatobacter sp.]
MLPSAAAVGAQVAAYLTDVEKHTLACVKEVAKRSAFGQIYQTALAAHAVLGNISTSALTPRLSPARSIAVRIPLLVSVGQSSVATGELRRFVELILWTIYFTDHPVEWRKFLENKTKGFSQDQRKPIAHAAHRQLNSYLEYAEELMAEDPSGLGSESVKGIRQAVWELNAAIHAGRIARESRSIPPHDDISDKALRTFLKIERATFSNCCVLL